MMPKSHRSRMTLALVVPSDGVDGLPYISLVRVVSTEPRAQWEMLDALRHTIRAFARSPDGQQLAIENGGEFNWGDAILNTPDDYWARDNLRVRTISNIVESVHHDENFYVEDE